jgi:hypothetical protein
VSLGLAIRPLAMSMHRVDENFDEGGPARVADEARQRRGLDDMLGCCPGSLRALLARASFLTGITARELVSDFPWPTRLRTLLPGGLMPSRSGLRHWKFREYDHWSKLRADFVELQLHKLGFGYLYVGNEVPVFLVDLRLLAPLLADLSAYLEASGCGNCAVVSASLDAGLIVGVEKKSRPGPVSENEAVLELCTWGISDALNARAAARTPMPWR